MTDAHPRSRSSLARRRAFASPTRPSLPLLVPCRIHCASFFWCFCNGPPLCLKRNRARSVRCRLSGRRSCRSSRFKGFLRPCRLQQLQKPRACQNPVSARTLVQHSGDAVLSTGIQFHSRAESEFENKGRGPTKRCGVLLLARPSMPSSNLACSRMQKWAA